MGHLHFPSRSVHTRSSGFVLILVLLFLLSASFLILSSLETEWLEMQMVSHQENKMLVFLDVESVLQDLENQIADGVIPEDVHTPQKIVEITMLGKDACKRVRYQVLVQLEKYHATTELLGVFVQPNDQKCPSKLPTGNIFWSQI